MATITNTKWLTLPFLQHLRRQRPDPLRGPPGPFGTYENPARFEDRCGFDPEKEERLPEMLAWRDVHRG